MKQFLLKVLVACISLAVPHLFVAWFFADGYTDPFYRRFTGPSAHSLILGTSRAAQGLHPQVLDSIIKVTNAQGPFFNCSFTMAHSPFGPAYLNSIKKKLDPTTSDGIFLVTVDPWALSNLRGITDDNPNKFRETDLCIGNMRVVNNFSPNLEYLVKNYDGPWWNMITAASDDSSAFLHENGWLQVTLNKTAEELAERTQKNLKQFREKYFPEYSPSEMRVRYLEKTMWWLQAHGKVYLIRMPTSPEMLRIEWQLWPDFTETMSALAARNNVQYVDGTTLLHIPNTTDGNHLTQKEGKSFSKSVTRLILSASKRDDEG